ncbi:MAG: ABC transporter ATP-binding protein [Bacillota bacterium]|nr:MAG: ABC transporter ATP-binding protein [Bacillota bacterium]
MNPAISVKNLTKDYGQGRGVFDVSFTVNKGEMFGFVGTNGSGKTTTIRHIMGFLQPDKGYCEVNGVNSWQNPCEIAKHVGYVPGEISFPDVNTGTSFLKIQAEFLGVRDMTHCNELISKLKLDTEANLKRMSKGMKQKTALVAALMHDPEILILDEPTTGLDPLMREEFISIVLEEKKRGKTVFMSSHIFQEIETTCDKVALIKNGELVDVADMEKIRNHDVKTFKIALKDRAELHKFLQSDFAFGRLNEERNETEVSLHKSLLNKLFAALRDYDVRYVAEVKYDLEKYFDEIFKGGKKNVL